MVSIRQIEKFGRQIGTNYHAERVVLFGSYAKGDATEDSDVDLLVVLPFEGRSVEQSVKMRMELRPKFPVDILVRTPEKIEQRIAMGDNFLLGVLEDGKVLYEADN